MNIASKLCLSTCVIVGIAFWLRFPTKEVLPAVSATSPRKISVQRENDQPAHLPTSLTLPLVNKEPQNELVYSTEFLSQLGKPFSGTFEITQEFANQLALTAPEKDQLAMTASLFFHEIKELERSHVRLVKDPKKGDFFRIPPYPEGADLLARFQENVRRTLPGGKGKAIAALLQPDGFASSFGTYTEEIYIEDIVHQGETITVVSWHSSGNAGDVVSWQKRLNKAAILQRFPWFEDSH